MSYNFTTKNLNISNTVLKFSGAGWQLHKMEWDDLQRLEEDNQAFNLDYLPVNLTNDMLDLCGFKKRTDDTFGEYYVHDKCFYPVRKSGKNFVFFHWDSDVRELKHLVHLKYLHQLEQALNVMSQFENLN